MPDFADYGSEREMAMLQAALEEHQYQLSQAGTRLSDIESETCNGCSYSTKASWGHSCDGWKDCRDDIERKQKFVMGVFK